jgi:hypothetical protein
VRFIGLYYYLDAFDIGRFCPALIDANQTIADQNCRLAFSLAKITTMSLRQALLPP